MVAQLLYLCKCTRQDMSANLTRDDYKKFMWVMQYLWGIQDLTLRVALVHLRKKVLNLSTSGTANVHRSALEDPKANKESQEEKCLGRMTKQNWKSAYKTQEKYAEK